MVYSAIGRTNLHKVTKKKKKGVRVLIENDSNRPNRTDLAGLYECVHTYASSFVHNSNWQECKYCMNQWSQGIIEVEFNSMAVTQGTHHILHLI